VHQFPFNCKRYFAVIEILPIFVLPLLLLLLLLLLVLLLCQIAKVKAGKRAATSASTLTLSKQKTQATNLVGAREMEF